MVEWPLRLRGNKVRPVQTATPGRYRLFREDV
jgi:hypothetical protein